MTDGVFCSDATADQEDAGDPKNTHARRRFGKGFLIALRPLGTQKDSPTHGPRCSEANQHPSHACGCAIDRPILYVHVYIEGQGTHHSRHVAMLLPEALTWLWRDVL